MQQNEELLSDNDILTDYLNSDGQPKNAAADRVRVQFNNKFREMQSLGEKYGLCPGELMVLINKNFGFREWRKIPWGQMDEILMWIRNNNNNFKNMFDDIDNKQNNYCITGGKN